MKSRTPVRPESEVKAEATHLASTVDAVVLSALAMVLSAGLGIAVLATLWGIARAVGQEAMLGGLADGALRWGSGFSMGMVIQANSLSPVLANVLVYMFKGMGGQVYGGYMIMLSLADLPIPVLLVFTVTGGVLLAKAVARIRAILRRRNSDTTE